MDTPARIDINEIGGPKPYDASQRNRHADGTPLANRLKPREVYDSFVKPRIYENKNPVLFPIEFCLYVAEKSGVGERELCHLIGRKEHYFSGMLSNGANGGHWALPTRLQHQMAALTNTDPVFWTSRYFDANQADQLSIVEKDITETNARFQPNGHWCAKIVDGRNVAPLGRDHV